MHPQSCFYKIENLCLSPLRHWYHRHQPQLILMPKAMVLLAIPLALSTCLSCSIQDGGCMVEFQPLNSKWYTGLGRERIVTTPPFSLFRCMFLAPRPRHRSTRKVVFTLSQPKSASLTLLWYYVLESLQPLVHHRSLRTEFDHGDKVHKRVRFSLRIVLLHANAMASAPTMCGGASVFVLSRLLGGYHHQNTCNFMVQVWFCQHLTGCMQIMVHAAKIDEHGMFR